MRILMVALAVFTLVAPLGAAPIGPAGPIHNRAWNGDFFTNFYCTYDQTMVFGPSSTLVNPTTVFTLEVAYTVPSKWVPSSSCTTPFPAGCNAIGHRAHDTFQGSATGYVGGANVGCVAAASIVTSGPPGYIRVDRNVIIDPDYEWFNCDFGPGCPIEHGSLHRIDTIEIWDNPSGYPNYPPGAGSLHWANFTHSVEPWCLEGDTGAFYMCSGPYPPQPRGGYLIVNPS